MTTSRRRNGMSPPYAKAQIAAWVAFGATVVEFLFFVSPVMPVGASVPITLFFFALVGAVCYYGAQTMFVDPIDVHLHCHLKKRDEAAKENGDGGRKSNPSWLDTLYDRYNSDQLAEDQLPEETMKQCWICDTQVADHSMHCKFCNKCVYHFDHHCMWMNTCIGKANYQPFYRTMVALFAMEFTHFFVQLGLVIDCFKGGGTADRANDWIGDEATNAILIFFIVFNSVSMILIGQLIWFHVGLRQENLTTYEFIVKDHRRKRELARLEGDLEAKRIVEMERARREGRNMDACRLRWGGMCRQVGCARCDPVDLPEPPDPEAGFAGALGTGATDADSAREQNGERDPGEVCQLPSAEFRVAEQKEPETIPEEGAAEEAPRVVLHDDHPFDEQDLHPFDEERETITPPLSLSHTITESIDEVPIEDDDEDFRPDPEGLVAEEASPPTGRRDPNDVQDF